MDPQPFPFLVLFKILIPLIGGIVCIYIFNRRYKPKDHLEKIGVKAEGIVFDTISKPNPGLNITLGTDKLKETFDDLYSTSTSIYPIIRFVTQQQEWVTKEYESPDFFLRKGDKVTVIYNPKDPNDFMIAGTIANSRVYLYLAVGIILLLGSIYQLVTYLMT